MVIFCTSINRRALYYYFFSPLFFYWTFVLPAHQQWRLAVLGMFFLCLHGWLLALPKDTNFHSPPTHPGTNQSGFSHTALTSIVHGTIAEQYKLSSIYCSLFIDFVKAFEVIDHDPIIKQITIMQAKYTCSIQFLQSFLSKVNNNCWISLR